jgi:hypothetical protein
LDVAVSHLGPAVIEKVGIIVGGRNALEGLNPGQGGAVIRNDAPSPA